MKLVEWRQREKVSSSFYCFVGVLLLLFLFMCFFQGPGSMGGLAKPWLYGRTRKETNIEDTVDDRMGKERRCGKK